MPDDPAYNVWDPVTATKQISPGVVQTIEGSIIQVSLAPDGSGAIQYFLKTEPDGKRHGPFSEAQLELTTAVPAQPSESRPLIAPTPVPTREFIVTGMPEGLVKKGLVQQPRRIATGHFSTSRRHATTAKDAAEQYFRRSTENSRFHFPAVLITDGSYTWVFTYDPDTGTVAVA